MKHTTNSTLAYRLQSVCLAILIISLLCVIGIKHVSDTPNIERLLELNDTDSIHSLIDKSPRDRRVYLDVIRAMKKLPRYDYSLCEKIAESSRLLPLKNNRDSTGTQLLLTGLSPLTVSEFSTLLGVMQNSYQVSGIAYSIQKLDHEKRAVFCEHVSQDNREKARIAALELLTHELSLVGELLCDNHKRVEATWIRKCAFYFISDSKCSIRSIAYGIVDACDSYIKQ